MNGLVLMAWFTLFTVSVCGVARGDTIALDALSLEAASPWRRQAADGEESLMGLAGAQGITKNRRLHFVKPEKGAETLNGAIEDEMDRIDSRGSRTDSSNGRRQLLEIGDFTTKGGIRGRRALFGTRDKAGRIAYSINKYYFWNSQGELCKVCAHVYGDQAIADEFERVILDTLREGPENAE